MESEIMRLEPAGNPIDEKAGEVLAQLEAVRRSYPIVGDNHLMDAEDFHLITSDHGQDVVRIPIPGGTRIEVAEGKGIWNAYRWVQSSISDETIWNGDGIYTISCSVRASFPETPTATGRLSFDVRETGSSSVTQVAQLRGEFGDTDGKWVRVVTTIDLRGVTNYNRSLLNIQGAETPILSQGAVIEARDFKIERGPDTDRFLPQAHTHTLEEVGLHTDTRAGSRVFVGDTMVYGDTGTLEIDRDAIKSGRILLSRQGPLVHVHFDQVVFNNAPGSVHLSRLPISYRPMGDTRFPLYTIGALSSAGSANIPSSGYFNVYGTDVDTALSGQVTYRTRHTWPLSLHAPTVTS